MESNVNPQDALVAASQGDAQPALATNPEETREFFIDNDYEVFTEDGQKVGVVEKLQYGYINIKRGLIFTKDLYVPVTVVGKVEADRVYLSVSRADADNHDWETVPPEWTQADNAAAADPNAVPKPA